MKKMEEMKKNLGEKIEEKFREIEENREEEDEVEEEGENGDFEDCDM